MTDEKMEQHHPFGPSRWPALMECPYWQGKPGGADAERGTRLHELFALAIDARAPTPNDAFERNAIALGERLRGMACEGAVILTEQQVRCPAPQGVEDIGVFGRFDALWYDKERRALHVADLKMVHNPDRDYAMQGIPYAIGYIAGNEPLPVETIWLHFCYVDEGKIYSTKYSREDAQGLYDNAYARIASLATGGTDYAAKQSGWCQLCARHESCPAPREVAEKVSAGALKDAPDRWPTFAPVQKAQLCVLADAVSKWADAIKKRAAEDAKGGVAIEDPEHGIFYGLQERQGKLQLDAATAWAVLRQYMTPEAFKACLDPSATRLVAALKAGGMPAKDAKSLVESAGVRGDGTVAFVRKGGAA